ncbi:MAG: DUF4907 domain-containing protein [Bacteroidetes bacterium]|nr:DUF4907 domain-containing protein [Bacteroidota bacterium]
MTTRKKSHRVIAFVFVAALSVIVYFTFRNSKEDKVFVEPKAIQTSTGWGYDIMVDGKPYIHQEFIPAVAERHGFKTKDDALLVARRVIEKISTNQLPTITLEDLKELGVIKDSVASK